jgi:exodeoxyribonuclease-1
MRYLNYRNFYDAYEWQWRDGRGKWDLLDVVRMTRALRPDGIKWPTEAGKPSNRLEHLTKANGISHDGAHDALADVLALIDLAKLINDNQPKLFSFLLNIMTSKAKVNELVNSGHPFVYTSGKFDSEFEKTSAVVKLVEHPKRQASLVFDLRYNIDDYADLSVDELVKAWRPEDKDQPKLPIKDILFNRCPAIAPLSVLDEDSQKRIHLTIEQIEINYKKFQKVSAEFSKKVLLALKQLDTVQEAVYAKRTKTVDSKLYDGFFGEGDKKAMSSIRSTRPSELNSDLVKSADSRLKELLPLYKARNYPKSLTTEDMTKWEEHRNNYLLSGNENSRLSNYFKQLDELSKDTNLDKNKQFLIDELKLYGESIIPSTDF